MKKYLCLIVALIIISSCTERESDDSMPSLKVETLGEFEWDFSLAGAVSGIPDTLFMTALGGDSEYSFTVRRKVYEDGIFSGRYAYTKAEDISCSEAISFHPTLRGKDGKEAVTLSLSAEEWTDFQVSTDRAAPAVGRQVLPYDSNQAGGGNFGKDRGAYHFAHGHGRKDDLP